jgi:hypothetical protein
MRLVWVPPGQFLMGAPVHEPDREMDEVQHQVTLTRGFWLGKFEVSNREFRAFRPAHRSWGMQGEKGEFNGDQQPVVCVDAADAKAFCRWAAQQTGRPIRLPTEAEWEYACRAGSTNAYGFGDDRRQWGDYAWIAANSGGHTQPVGLKKPNAWGLHDMHGNVAEWVHDFYTYYPGGPQTDPKGPAQSKSHAWRECSWSSQPFECRCATRDYSEPTYKSAALGLRVACDVNPAPEGQPATGSVSPADATVPGEPSRDHEGAVGRQNALPVRVRISNLTSRPQRAAPVTFGQAFCQGQFPPAVRVSAPHALASTQVFLLRLRVGLFTHAPDFDPRFATPYRLVVGEQGPDGKRVVYDDWKTLGCENAKLSKPDVPNYGNSYAYSARAALVCGVDGGFPAAREALAVLEAMLPGQREVMGREPYWAITPRGTHDAASR